MNAEEELRQALIACKDALESVWAAIGDALCSGRGIEKAYANSVAHEVQWASNKAKAILGRRDNKLKSKLRQAMSECDGKEILRLLEIKFAKKPVKLGGRPKKRSSSFVGEEK